MRNIVILLVHSLVTLARSQTVTTWSNRIFRNSSTCLEREFQMSRPISAMTLRC